MLPLIAWSSLGLAFICAAVIALDEIRHPQKMWIMNIVWPVTSLYFSIFALWAYFAKGHTTGKNAMRGMSEEQMHQHMEREKQQTRQAPTFSQTALAASHCGAGCALADVVTEFTVFGLGVTFLGSELYASFLWDFLAAWTLGIVFQYFTIKPMRNLSILSGIWAAMKADTLSILTFQIGMYGWMALVYFKLFSIPHLHPDQPGYWLMMQIAMVCGFVTSLPINWLLVKIGWKEAMG